MSDLFGYKTARFSECRSYRYTLWRWWNKQRGYVLFIGLNPSTADETRDDPTIRRSIGFARDWGYGGMCMVNLFAFRATKPIDMMMEPEPIGPENDDYLKTLSKKADIIIAAWGKPGNHLDRDRQVYSQADYSVLKGFNLMCLEINSDGSPKHPLHVKRGTQPFPFNI